MSKVCLYFQVHQPFRLKKMRIFDIGKDDQYFNEEGDVNYNNRKIFEKVAQKCYLPANQTFLELLEKHPQFKISYSISGVFLEQAEMYMPEVLESFKKLVATGRVELLNETYYHSLAFLKSRSEFRRQVQLHKRKIKELFGVTPTVFRNTELIYSNDVAFEVAGLGFKGILAEGADHVLGWRSPNFVYSPKGTPGVKLLLKNYKLSDDIAFRFSDKNWSEYPLTANKFATWVSAVNGNGEVVNLFMDYETFGEHQWEDTGIFNFLKALPEEILKHPDNSFATPSEIVETVEVKGELDVPFYMSWADIERDLSAWLSNPMQHDALDKLFQLEDRVLNTFDEKLIANWRKLTTSDHFYYMCTKYFNDGDVHKYFSPYESPYEAFIAFMNTLHDFKLRLQQIEVAKKIGSTIEDLKKGVTKQFEHTLEPAPTPVLIPAVAE
jgi:alpha-amylase